MHTRHRGNHDETNGFGAGFFEALSPEARVELLCRLHALAIEQAEAVDEVGLVREPPTQKPHNC